MAKQDNTAAQLAEAQRLIQRIHDRARTGLGVDPRLQDEILRDIARWTMPQDSSDPPPPIPPDPPNG